MRRSRKILFLDRDDTIIKDFGYLNDPDNVQLLEGLVPALKIFRDAGFEFVVTTNQSGLTRGLVKPVILNLIHNKIQYLLNSEGLRILDFYSAPYSHNHYRRKPNPGLTLEVMSDYGVDLKNAIFAGDKWRDLVVGFNLGAKTVLVNEAKNQRTFFKSFNPDLCLSSWSDFNLKVFKLLLEGRIQNLTNVPFASTVLLKVTKENQTPSNLSKPFKNL